MKRLLYATIALFLALSAAGSTIRLTLRLEPSEALPAVPMLFIVEAFNSGAAPVTLPSRVALQMTLPDGRPFVRAARVRSDDAVANWPIVDGDSLVIAPGKTKRIVFTANEDIPWLCGSDFQPGKYRLQLVSDEGLRSDRIGDRVLEQPGLLDPVVSNEVTFVLQTPTGVDAQVWALFKGKDTCMGIDSIAGKVWDQYPQSRYTGYLVRPVSDPYAKNAREMELANLEATLKRNPGDAMASALKYTIGSIYLELMISDAATDVTKAYDESTNGRRILQEVIDQNSGGFAVQKHARENIGSAMSMAQLRDLNARENGKRATKKATPFVNCVTPVVAGMYTIQFGYDNPNTISIDIDDDADSVVVPAPTDPNDPLYRVDPRLLEPGRHASAFKLTVTAGTQVSWTLQGQTASPTQDSRRCSDDDQGDDHDHD